MSVGTVLAQFVMVQAYIPTPAVRCMSRNETSTEERFSNRMSANYKRPLQLQWTRITIALTVLRTYRLTHFRTYSLTHLQSYALTDLQSYALADSQSSALTDLQSYALTVLFGSPALCSWGIGRLVWEIQAWRGGQHFASERNERVASGWLHFHEWRACCFLFKR